MLLGWDRDLREQSAGAANATLPHALQIGLQGQQLPHPKGITHWYNKHHWRFALAQGNADGAYFGTTFPHLLLMTYPSLRPPPAADSYVPRVFGFKLHPSAFGREPAGAAGASSSGAAAGPSAAAAPANNSQRVAGASTSAPAGGAGVGGDRRGKRREDERQQQAAGGSNATRTMASMDGDSLDGRQEMDIMRPR